MPQRIIETSVLEEDKKIDNSSNTNKESNSPTKEQDNTLPSGKLPRTGLNMTLPIERVIVITLIAVVFYKKYNSYKDIK